MRAFLDSSAFAKRYIEEKGSDAVGDICLEAGALAISVICVPEVLSALCRLKRERVLSKPCYHDLKDALYMDIRDVTLYNLSAPVLEKSVEILEHSAVRAMDALHVACALDWGAELFVSADKRQMSAAKKAGLKTKFVG